MARRGPPRLTFPAMSDLLSLRHARPHYAPDDGAGSGAGDASGADEQPPVGDDGSPGGDDTGSQSTDDQTTALKAEAQKLRARARAAEKERDELRAAQQTDAEKLAARAEQAAARATKAEGKLRDQALRIAISEHTKASGIVAAPATVARLIDADAITWTDDGEPDTASLTAALKTLAKSDPALVRQGSSDGGSGGDRRGNVVGMNDLIRGKAGRAA